MKCVVIMEGWAVAAVGWATYRTLSCDRDTPHCTKLCEGSEGPV